MATNGNDERGGFRAQRNARGLSQEGLARQANCSTGYVRLIEKGYKPATSAVLARIQRILNDERPATSEPLAKAVDTGRDES